MVTVSLYWPVRGLTLGVAALVVLLLTGARSVSVFSSRERLRAKGSSMQWNTVSGIGMPVMELVVRGTAMYWFLTDDELLGTLRAKGVSEVAEVRHAYLESDGVISVILNEGRRVKG